MSHDVTEEKAVLQEIDQELEDMAKELEREPTEEELRQSFEKMKENVPELKDLEYGNKNIELTPLQSFAYLEYQFKSIIKQSDSDLGVLSGFIKHHMKEEWQEMAEGYIKFITDKNRILLELCEMFKKKID